MSETASHRPVIEMHDAQVAALSDTSRVALEKVNWTVLAGDFWVVAGPQHSGKSDLLMHAAGLMAPARGECAVFGGDTRNLDEAHLAGRRRIGFVFTDGKLFNQFTVAQNIALPLRYHTRLPEAEIAGVVESLLDLLDLARWADAMPGALAAAWRQRAALARALALNPELLLLDNPNAGLTARHRLWLVDFLDQLWRGHDFLGRRPVTVVVTTDDLHPWKHPNRKFAALHEGAFALVGPWGGDEFMRHHTVRDLLALPPEAAPPAG